MYLLGCLKRADALGAEEDAPVVTTVTPPEVVVYCDDDASTVVPILAKKGTDKILVTDAQGKLQGFISQEQRWLEEFFELREFLPVTNVLDAIYDAVLMINGRGRVIYANPSYTRILGVPIYKVLGKYLADIEPEARCLEVLKTGKPRLNESWRINSVGVEVVGSITPILKGREVVGVITVFRNISEMLRLSEELRRLQGVAKYLQDELRRTERVPPAFESMVGKNGRFREAIKLAARVAPTEATVMIRGENGVGKELLARAIHAASQRKDQPFIHVNCAAIPETLLESELFGYEGGAFTGAKRGGKPGKFELAHGGTLFLDEVGDMSVSMQAKLLRALQDKEIERVGGQRPIKVNVRIISATNHNLEMMVKNHTFREDLYYRLNVVPILLPPLRDRKDDIPLLVDCFLREFLSKEGKGNMAVSNEVMDIFYNHHWPGNIRELRNAVEHAVVVCPGRVILPEHLPGYFMNIEPPAGDLEGLLRLESRRLTDVIARVEKEALVKALRAAKNNRSKAIEILGISRRTFYEKLRKYGLE
ncbi:MAG TPA: sigma 54-interacting transcriptional regulator [Clostridia bacterium]|nr:sigma 54-interacting transcriptional regulator [Clostridia bacterium]